MPYVFGYGGVVELTFNGVGKVIAPVRNIQITTERASLDVTLVSDFREKRVPGRVRRTVSFDLIVEDGTGNNAIREHIYPTSLANAQDRSVVLTYTDESGQAYAVTGHIVSAGRTDDGSGIATWSCQMDEA
jgi:hypothetical protein